MHALSTILAASLLVAACEASPRDTEAPGAEQERETAAQAAEPGTYDRSKAGTPMPDTTLLRRDEGPMSLQAYLGTPTLVNLWATWCAPCIAEMPALDRLAEARGGGLDVVLVSQDSGGWEQISPFLERVPIEHAVVLADPDMDLATGYPAPGLPMTILYDAAGKELWRYAGPNEWDEEGALAEEEGADAGDAGDESASAGDAGGQAAADTGLRAHGVRYVARGQEPGWLATLVPGERLTVAVDYGETEVRFPAPAQAPRKAPFSFELEDGGHSLSLTVRDESCEDPMSGRAYPHSVSLTLDGRTFRGCGTAL
ncbi:MULTISPECIES: redoxin family protein [Pacificimonas]|nr:MULTISPECIES: redoxin family protein [Pacificimonas]MBZ6378105.1 redoxin family protein [Pacificimonas aurantium]